ncbi:MAG: SDR family NAD(P)-dependent oxidoreductase [Candidatus Lokiarchaeota archaeon]|nr:SDR family NAD(P)-dependent oxidoreductase [Candidatus Harpocratesius repetitus]
MKKPHEILKILNNTLPIWGYNPQGFEDITVLVTLCENNAVGILNTESLSILQTNKIIKRISKQIQPSKIWGIRITNEDFISDLDFSTNNVIAICSFVPSSKSLEILKKKSLLICAEVLTSQEAKSKAKWADFFLVRGNEAGGFVSNRNSFIQIQEFYKLGYSFIIEGGFGIYNVGAALIGGALGVVYESQLYLLNESPLSHQFKSYIKTLQENDFYLFAESEHFNFRLIGKLANKSIREVKLKEKDFYKQILEKEGDITREEFTKILFSVIQKDRGKQIGFPDFSSKYPKHSFLPCDHGIIFANQIAEQFQSISRFIQKITEIIIRQHKLIKKQWPFQESSPFAQNINVKYPIIQGPMANITESIEFAQIVADHGALPTFALGGLMGPEADALLEKISNSSLQNYQYMAGIIGLEVVKKRRELQLESIKKHNVPFTLIAAGSVDLAKQVIRQGERVFLHTPALSMFKEAVKNQIEFLILEGSECGGHIGTLSSWILWENILQYCKKEQQSFSQKINVIFAGGIINETSSAMLAMMIGDHLDIINPGIQMGTSYLFTPEITSSKALSPLYQNLLLNHDSTRVIGATVNTRARVIPSIFSSETIKKELHRITEEIPISKRKELYEKDNLGALRIAAQAEIWNNDHIPGTGTTQFIPISPEKQEKLGAFMTGESLTLRTTVVPIKNLHYDITKGGFHKVSNLQKYNSLNQILNFKNQLKSKPVFEKTKKKFADSRVAIVGIGGVFPDASNINEFWDNILSEKYSITEVPKDRWNYEIYFSEDRNQKDKTYTKIGGFIKDFKFKSIKFRIPPQMAKRMDPVQKWALTAAKEALMDANYPIDGKQSLSLAVIIGNSLGGEIQRYNDKRVFFNEINHYLYQAEKKNIGDSNSIRRIKSYLEENIIKNILPINEDTMPGELSNIIAGRISNVFNLNGKNLTTDAACASSLAALDTAVKGLLLGDYDAVLAGGADHSMDPSVFIKFSKIGALSAKKSCPFDAEADGFVMGEGAGFVVLKRLSDAIRDNNKIYAVIRGIGASSDGRGKGITAPNLQGQKMAVIRALDSAKIQEKDLQYIECHGTSTVIGDATELMVLQELLHSKNPSQKIAIGSVKSQIGHLKSAAAIASIIKTSLALYHKIIPPSINFNIPNPKIDWDNVPFYVNTHAKEWIRPQNSIRRAGVSAFGFGGTNFHVILEEFCPESLNNSINSIPEYIPYSEGIIQTNQKSAFSFDNSDPSLVFMFSGQGSQYVGMGHELYETIPEIRDILNRANEICQSFGDFNLLQILFGDKSKSKSENQKILTQTQFTQPAIFSLEIALFKYLNNRGIVPGIVAGHSLGEFSALVTAGVMDFEDALKAVIIRGQAMGTSTPDSKCGMAALLCPISQVEEILKKVKEGNVSISNYNSPTQTVISGDLVGIQNALKVCQKENVRAKQLNVSQAFHSKFVASAGSKLAEYLNTIKFHKPNIPVYSNVLGSAYPTNSDKIKGILLDQITSPVRWTDEIEQIYNAGGRKFVEVGPKKALFYFAKEILKKAKNVSQFFTLTPKKSEVEYLKQITDEISNQMQNREQNFSLKSKYLFSKQNLPKILSQNKEISNNNVFDELISDKTIQSLSTQPHFREFLAQQKEILAPMLKASYSQFIRLYRQEQERKKKESSQFIQNTLQIGVTGVGLGIPGKNRNVFDDSNIIAILNGENFIEPLPEEVKKGILDKNIVRLNKTSNGDASFIEIKDISQVIHLAGQIGAFDPKKDFLLDDKLLNALDITSKLAIGAGLEALKDAGIPLVKSKITTTTGKIISGDWALPEELQRDTGVIFASAFPGLDNLVKDLTTHLTQQLKLETFEKFNQKFSKFLNEISHSKIKKELEEWYYENKALIFGDKKDLIHFNRAFLFRILSMGHSQFAQIIKAKGPNTQVNAACASTTNAFAIAEDWIRTGRCNRVIVISGDCPTTKSLFPWLGAGFVASGAGTIKQNLTDAVLPFGIGRNGLIAGAGASAFVLETQSESNRRGIKPIVDLLGTQISNSAYHGSRLDKLDITEEFNRFITTMVNQHKITKSEIARKGMFVSHETYTPARGGSSESELEALSNTFGPDVSKLLIINTKGFTGHLMGVGMEEAVAIKSIEYGIIPPIANFGKIDPKYSKFYFSTGIKERKDYAIRFAAGFGSQIAILMFRKNTPTNRKDEKVYHAWLQSVAGSTSLFLDGRVLKVDSKQQISFSQKQSIPSILQTSKSNETILATLIQIIAEKTGYDISDLEPQYHLEEDLGIDTIKQAEIFGEIGEKWNIEENQSWNISEMQSIADIAKVLSRMVNDSSQISSQTSSNNHINQNNWEEKVRAIISEITGYDHEDIQLDFDLEEDLGIDTIKQAEIFGRIREEWQIPEETSINLTEFRSINDILAFLSKNFSGSSSQTKNTIDLSTSETNIDQPTQIKEEEIKKIISEVTGYDLEDIQSDFDLEEDLGIDTIKQAEIFGRIREEWQISEDTQINLADFRTIQDILTLLNSTKKVNNSIDNSVATVDNSQISKSNDKNRSESNIDQVKSIIAEITGYDSEDLELDFDLEEDLGIDTIKQAEIFGQIREKWQISDESLINIAEFRTIRDILNYITKINERNLSSQEIPQIAKSSNENRTVNEIIESRIKSIISRITGYDNEDLELDFDLEEDLGIDTIKQAEIFGSIREEWQISEETQINLAEFRTIGDIVKYLIPIVSDHDKSDQLDFEKSDSFLSRTNDENDLENKIDVKIKIYSIKPVLLNKSEKIDENKKIFEIPMVFIEFNSYSDYGTKIKEDLSSKGIKLIPILFKYETGFEGISSFVDNIKKHDITNGYSICLYCRPFSKEENLNQATTHFSNIFNFIKLLGPEYIKYGFLLSKNDNIDESMISNPISAAFSGFFKSLSKEMSFKFLHLSFTTPLLVSSEILKDHSVFEIQIDEQGNRYTLTRIKIGNQPLNQARKISSDDLVVVTGGARGITFECLNKLTDSIHPSIALLGRTPLNPDFNKFLSYSEEQMNKLKKERSLILKKEKGKVTPVIIQKEWNKFLNQLEVLRNINILQKKGLHVEYFSVDVTQSSQISEIMKEISRKFEKPITVIIHGAGMEESKNFSKKDPKIAKLIVDIKINGLANLLNNIPLESLKYCILFSSIAGRYGNQGQVDYAFANAFLSRLSWNSGFKIPTLAIDWSAWADVGMATHGSTMKVLKMAGVIPIPVQTGTALFSYLVSNGYTGEYIVSGDLGLFEQNEPIITMIDTLQYPMLSKIRYNRGQVVGSHQLSTDRDIYLLDHQIEGRPVLPGVMVLETFAEFYHALHSTEKFVLKEVEFNTPLKILPQKRVSIELQYDMNFTSHQNQDQNQNNHGLQVENLLSFYSKTYPRAMKGKPLIKEHFKAKIEISPQLNSLIVPKFPSFISSLPLLSQEEIYTIFFHGPRFKVINELLMWEKESLITSVSCQNQYLFSHDLNTSNQVKFTLDPLGIESLFQTAALLDLVQYSQLSLPSKIGKVVKLSNEIPKYAFVEYIGRDQYYSYFDACLFSAEGKPIIMLKNLGLIHTNLNIDLPSAIKEKFNTLAEISRIIPHSYASKYQIIPLPQLTQMITKNSSKLSIFLTKNEQERIKKMKNNKRFHEHIAGVICAKMAYFKYLNQIPKYLEIEVVKRESGQPYFIKTNTKETIPIHLSISHSHFFACAVVNHNPIGLDLEKIEDRSPSFYKEVFTLEEQRYINQNSIIGTQFWTAKEAFSKAIGTGLKMNLKEIELAHKPDNNHFELKYFGNQKYVHEITKDIQWISQKGISYILSLCEIPALLNNKKEEI